MEEYQGFTWEQCRKRMAIWVNGYEQIKRQYPNSFNEKDEEILNQQRFIMKNMVSLIDVIEKDVDFPSVTKTISHHSLRLGLPHNHPASVLNVWIDWRETKFHIGIGPFGQQEDKMVSFIHAVPTIKHYIQRLEEIEKEYQNDDEK